MKLMYGYADSKVIIVKMIPHDQSVGWICTGMWLGPAIKFIQKKMHVLGAIHLLLGIQPMQQQ